MIGGRPYADRTTLIKGGYVLTLDPELGDLPLTDVLIDGDKIAAIGRKPLGERQRERHRRDESHRHAGGSSTLTGTRGRRPYSALAECCLRRPVASGRRVLPPLRWRSPAVRFAGRYYYSCRFSVPRRLVLGLATADVAPARTRQRRAILNRRS
jgi:hypothetical protein